MLFEFDPAEAPEAAAERFEPLLADALERGHSALWYSRFPIGPGAVEFANATAYDRAWDARFRGRPVVTLCPYVLAGEEAGERIAHLDGWHDAVLDAGRPASASATGRLTARMRSALIAAVELDYTIRRSTRARRVRVAVDAHDGVQVTLPARAREREAALAVAELRPWIERRLAEVRAARERLAVPAGHLPYLGSHLALAPEAGRLRAHRRGDALLVPGRRAARGDRALVPAHGARRDRAAPRRGRRRARRARTRSSRSASSARAGARARRPGR